MRGLPHVHVAKGQIANSVLSKPLGSGLPSMCVGSRCFMSLYPPLYLVRYCMASFFACRDFASLPAPHTPRCSVLCWPAVP